MKLLYGLVSEYKGKYAKFIAFTHWTLLILFRHNVFVLICSNFTTGLQQIWKGLLVMHILYHLLSFLTVFFTCKNTWNINQKNISDRLYAFILNFMGFFSCLFLAISSDNNGDLAKEQKIRLFRHFLNIVIAISVILFLISFMEFTYKGLVDYLGPAIKKEQD